MGELCSGKLRLLNDALPRLLSAISPDGTILPDLIDLLKTGSGGPGIVQSIATMIQSNPRLEKESRPALLAMLKDPNESIRLGAASIIARFPGEKDMEAVLVLISALKVEKLRDPHAYDPIVSRADNTTRLRESEKANDISGRFESIRALGEFGPGAGAALPALMDFAGMSQDGEAGGSDLRELALVPMDLKMGSDIAKDTGQSAHFDWIVVGDSDVMLTLLVGGEAQVAAVLARNLEPQRFQTPGKVMAGNITW